MLNMFLLSQTLCLSLLIPFLGTLLGSFMVFFLKKQINDKVLKILLGFSSGVMIAAAVWSLLLPAINSFVETSNLRWIVPSVGFIVGIIILFITDKLVPHMHIDNIEEGIDKHKLSKTLKLFLAITIHNIPEGLAVGLVVASAINQTIDVEKSALILSIGIAIQNFPEGAVVSMPLKESGLSKGKAFMYGALSGIVEPIAAIIALLITREVSVILPYALSFAAGAMIYVVADELIPEANSNGKSSLATIGLAIGFILMMILDITLS